MDFSKIDIVIPYINAEKETAIWAFEERLIDFKKEPEKAARCTTAFAAVELGKYLKQTLLDVEISYVCNYTSKRFYIELNIMNRAGKEDGFFVEPRHNGLLIIGQGRAGLLYGIYEFLHIQGWRWYAPGKEGEIFPTIKTELYIPIIKKEYKPDMKLGRGFYFEGISKESSELWLWMARNRLNLATYRPATGPLGNKLGMIFRVGGHIFEEILDPDRMMPTGRTLWEEHINWYGLPDDGIREKEKALKVQFCISQPDLLEFIGEELLKYLNGEWKEAEQIDIWGFDTWGSGCTCKCCKTLGNGSDQMLFLLSSIRESINAALKNGRLDHNVKLVMCGYEGTSTLMGPTKPFPQNLIEAEDYVTFFPIKRCYAHNFTDDSCQTNVMYVNALKSWIAQKPHMPIMMSEYYNVSKYEDLPILFTSRMKKDLFDFHLNDVCGMLYMHVPLVNWGMRTLTQLLYAYLAWDVHSDTETLLDEYFCNWYGPYAKEMRKVYCLIEKAWLYCADWRNWGNESMLTMLQKWDGSRPEMPISMENHFVTVTTAVENGRQSVQLMQEAKCILNGLRIREKQEVSERISLDTKVGVNPFEIAIEEKDAIFGKRLGEDYRLLLYGLDTMTIMTELASYYDSLYKNETENVECIWRRIEEVEERMDSYYIPIGFDCSGAGLVSRDALTRSQVGELLRRIRKHRGNVKC